MTSSVFLRLEHWWNFAVVRWQLLISVLVVWLAGLWLKGEYGQDDTNLWLVMQQFLAVIRVVIGGLFAVSIFACLAAWIFFAYAAAKKRIVVSAELGDGLQAEAGNVPLTISLRGALIRPLLGTIRARLIFKDGEWSAPVILDSDLRMRRSLLRFGISGSGKTMLHNRGIYDAAKVYFVFCDMFSLIAVPYTLQLSAQLVTLPKAEQPRSIKAQPHAVEEQKHRVEIPRRVEGEYINYKEFETGDNIRRIVWKIYAKNGQLVVRVPETRDPYASHLYFYVSWFQGFGLAGGIFDAELLNVYKDKVRTLFEALEKNGYDITLPADQEVPRLPGQGDKNNELFQITSASWQDVNPPSVFVKPSKAAFVCISSLTPADQAEQLIRALPPAIPIVAIKLSDAIPSPFRIRVQEVFFRPVKGPADALRKPWLIAPLRQRLQKNEAALARLLEARGYGWLTSSLDIES